MRLNRTLGLLGTAAFVASLIGCASQPQISAQRESSHYLARARANYHPPGPPSDPWGPYIREAAKRYDVPEKWIREVMHQESGGHLYGGGGELITSGAGAMGLMQVMPATYDDLRSRYSELGDDPFDPHNNILAGSAYLREMYDIYGSPGFLAAYNAGPGRLDDYLTRSRTLPTETRRYVAAIGPRISGYEPSRPSPGAMYAMSAVPLDFAEGPRAAFAATIPVPSQPVLVAEARPEQPYIRLRPPAPEPVEVAEAAPAQGYIKLNPPAPEPPPTVVAEETAPGPYIKLNPPEQTAEAAPEPPPYVAPKPARPVVLAQAERPRSLLAPMRNPFVTAEAAPREPEFRRPEFRRPEFRRPEFRHPEPPREAEFRRPEPRRPEPWREEAPPPRYELAEGAGLPEPPVPPASRWRRPSAGNGRPVEVAMYAEPHHPRPQRSSAAAELVALGPTQHGFGFISSANAAPLGRPAPEFRSSGDWAVQVGAFSNQSQAHFATDAARSHAGQPLHDAHAVVSGVRQNGGTLYRARLGGLSREAAEAACERLSHARTSCMIVSPQAQR